LALKKPIEKTIGETKKWVIEKEMHHIKVPFPSEESVLRLRREKFVPGLHGMVNPNY
jgi:hypothetical protein